MSEAYGSNEKSIYFYIRKQKRMIYLGFCFSMLLFILYSAISFIRHGMDAIYFIFLILGIGVLARLIYFYSIQVKSFNKIIVQIEFSGDIVQIKTMAFSIFWGMIDKNSIEKEINKEDLKFSLTKIVFPYNKVGEITQVYSLSHGKDTYALVNYFFDDFEELKAELERLPQ